MMLNRPFSCSALCAGIAALAALAFCLAGCGPGYKLVPASGTVTVDGKPAEGVTVLYQGVAAAGKLEAGPPLMKGVTDAQGRYTMTTADLKTGGVVGAERDGVVAGTYRVLMAMSEEQAPREEVPDALEKRGVPKSKRPKVVLPPEAYGGKITIDIPPGGTDKADFELTTPRSVSARAGGR